MHPDCLHRSSPAYRAHPGATSIFVWDDEALRQEGWSLKRIGFVYECLLDLPVVIRRGDPVVEVRRFAAEQGCDGIATVATPDPHLTRQARALHAEVLPADPFVEVRGRLDLKRFSRYWSKVEGALPG